MTKIKAKQLASEMIERGFEPEVLARGADDYVVSLKVPLGSPGILATGITQIETMIGGIVGRAFRVEFV